VRPAHLYAGDEPPSTKDAQDGLGITVVVVDRLERWAH
jgi:hypothetical protein